MDELLTYRADLVDDVLVLGGELDDDGLVALEQDLEKHTGDFSRSLVVDLTDVSLLPSSAIRVLALTHQRAQAAGVEVELLAADGSFSHRVLQICAFPHRVTGADRDRPTRPA